MASMTYLAENHLLRTVRRYGIDVPLRHRLFTLAAGGLLVLAIVVGACVGLVAGLPTDPGLARDTLLATAGVAWGLVVAFSAPGRTLRTALDSSRGWALLAATPVTPREFAYGRYVLPELAKAVLVSATVLGGTWGLILAPGQHPTSAVWPALVATGGLVVGVLLRCAVALAGPARRLTGLSPWVTRALLAAVAALLVAAYLISRTAVEPALIPVTLAALAAGTVALVADRRLRVADWATVSEVALRSRTVRHEAPALPEARPRAILAVDARRLLRSVESRMKPVVNYLAFLIVMALGAGAYAVFGEAVTLPPDVPRAELAAGLCAFAGYGASVAAASVLALDADRHAYTLWSLIPGAMRAVARVRAGVGSLVVAVSGLVATVAAAAVLDLGGRDIVLALVAVGAMAAFGPVIELAGSMRWPELDWADTTEIGTSSGARYALGFTVGIPVAGALALARTLQVQPSTGQLVLLGFAVLLLSPLVATTVMSPVTRAVTRSSHA